jgi:hypothetical protein
MAEDRYAGARMSVAEAERLMREGKIENYVVENGVAIVKRGMDVNVGVSWGTENGGEKK